MPDKQRGFVSKVKSTIAAFGNIWTGSGSFWSDGTRTYNFKPTDVNWAFSPTEAYNQNEIVYQSLRVYLKTIMFPSVLFYEVVNDKSFRKYKGFVKSTENNQHRIVTIGERAKALQEIESHSLLDLFNKPNNYQSWTEFAEAAFGTWKLTGSVLIYGIGPDIGINAGKYTELHVIPTNLLTIVYSGDWRNPILRFDYTIDGKQIPLNPNQVCYIKDWNPGSTYEGFSPITPGARTIKTDGWNREAQAFNYINGGTAYLVSNGSEVDEFRYTQEQAKMIDDKLANQTRGFWNNGKAISVSGKVNVDKFGDTIVDMNLIDAASYSRGVISQLWGVDSILIGDAKNSKYSNGGEARKALITNTIVPDQIHFLEKLGGWLLPMYQQKGKKYHLEFDHSVYPELQPDLALLAQVYGKPPVTNNEVRALYNYDKLDDDTLGNAILMPSGYEPLQSVVAGVSPDTSETDAQIEEALKNAKY